MKFIILLPAFAASVFILSCNGGKQPDPSTYIDTSSTTGTTEKQFDQYTAAREQRDTMFNSKVHQADSANGSPILRPTGMTTDSAGK